MFTARAAEIFFLWGYMRSVTSADFLFTDSFASRPESVLERLFSLPDPWRENFLRYIAARAGAGNDGLPAREEVLAYLEADPELCREVRLMLYAWTKR